MTQGSGRSWTHTEPNPHVTRSPAVPGAPGQA
jgi:hypothetical protein